MINKDIVKFQDDLKDISSQVDSVKHELQTAIDNGVEDTKNIINEEINSLSDEISKIKANTVEDVKSKLDFIPDIKF